MESHFSSAGQNGDPMIRLSWVSGIAVAPIVVCIRADETLHGLRWVRELQNSHLSPGIAAVEPLGSEVDNLLCFVSINLIKKWTNNIIQRLERKDKAFAPVRICTYTWQMFYLVCIHRHTQIATTPPMLHGYAQNKAANHGQCWKATRRWGGARLMFVSVGECLPFALCSMATDYGLSTTLE